MESLSDASPPDGGDGLKGKPSGRKQAKRAGFEESDWVSSPRLGVGVIASRPASKKTGNQTIALAGTLQNDILSPTAQGLAPQTRT